MDHKRELVRVYQVNSKAMQPLIDVLNRHYKAGTMPWIRTAQDYLETLAQDAARDGLTVKEPDMAWTVIRTGILESLHIKRTDDGFECEPDFMFTYKELRDAPWFQWACEHKDEVNAAGLGAQISGDAPPDKVLGKWIKAIGIDLISKRIDAQKLVEIKEEISNPAKTVAASTTPEEVDAPNKTVGVANKQQ